MCSDISCQLLARLHLGDLDGALVVLPADTALPHDLEGVTLSHEAMRPVQARTSARPRSSRSSEFYRRNWVLNPVGCWVREEIEIKNRVERLDAPLVVAAELHNPDLQLSLIAGNVGGGMLRAGFLRTHSLRTRLSIIEHPNFNISIGIAFFRARHLGTRERPPSNLSGCRWNTSKVPLPDHQRLHPEIPKSRMVASREAIQKLGLSEVGTPLHAQVAYVFAYGTSPAPGPRSPASLVEATAALVIQNSAWCVLKDRLF